MGRSSGRVLHRGDRAPARGGRSLHSARGARRVRRGDPRRRAMTEIRRLEIRSVTGEELDLVGRLLHELNLEVEDETPSAQVLAARVAELLGGGDTEIILADDPPAGLAVLRLRKAIWTPQLEASLVELYVIPERRGRELERELLEAVMDAARARGADFIELTAGSSDVHARDVYEDLGFDNREIGSEDGRALHYSRPL